MQIKIHQLSDRSLEIKLGNEIHFNMLQQVIQVKKLIEQTTIKGFVEMNTAYASLGIHFNPTITSFTEISTFLNGLLSHTEFRNNKMKEGFMHTIPVCYEPSISQDLEEFIKLKNTSLESLIHMHSEVEYRLYMKGFLPGFMYLGDLPPTLHMDRKEIPSLNIQAGSIAIGGMQTGIYGIDSPGGWWVIGRTPIPLFDRKKGPLLTLEPGDKISFLPIDLKQYLDLGGAM